MPYAASDPRSKLASAAPAKAPPASDFGGIGEGRFYAMAPAEQDALAKTWYARGQNFLAAYSEVKTGAKFERKGQPDEYMLILPDANSAVRVTAGGEASEIKGRHVVFMPPGDSTVEALADGTLTRFFTSRSADLIAKCQNSASFVADPNVPPLQNWPDPKDGFKIRAYSLDFKIEEGRFGRLFRCTTFMVNYFDHRTGPRDPKNLSPHDHDDFQQCSLVLDGTYKHHLRWPWITDSTKWRDDVHEKYDAPSVIFIPSRAMHTSEAFGLGKNLLVDVFCPPRVDFSSHEGWVLNADEYPMPGEG